MKKNIKNLTVFLLCMLMLLSAGCAAPAGGIDVSNMTPEEIIALADALQAGSEEAEPEAAQEPAAPTMLEEVDEEAEPEAANAEALEAEWRNTPTDAKRIAAEHKAEYWKFTVHQVNADYAIEAPESDFYEIDPGYPHYIYEIPLCLYAEKAIMPYKSNKEVIAEIGEEKALAYAKAAESFTVATYLRDDADMERNVWTSYDESTVYQSVDGLRARVLYFDCIRRSSDPAHKEFIDVHGTTIIDVLFTLDENGDIQDAKCIQLAEIVDLGADEDFIKSLDDEYGY